jgi:hypothetical protein
LTIIAIKSIYLYYLIAYLYDYFINKINYFINQNEMKKNVLEVYKKIVNMSYLNFSPMNLSINNKCKIIHILTIDIIYRQFFFNLIAIFISLKFYNTTDNV